MAPQHTNGPYGQIILFGDSITENSFDTGSGYSYAAALSHAFKRRLDVVNRGFSGYNTRHARTVLPRFMPNTTQAKVELLIVCFGANDSCLANDPTDHHVPLDEYRDNLVAMISSPAVQAHSPQVLLVTPPPIDEHQRILADQARGFSQLRRTAENTRKYAEACREVGAELKIPVVDIWTSFLLHAGWVGGEAILGSRDNAANVSFQNLFSDGLHLTPEGYRVVFREVMGCITANCASLDPDKISYRYPPWEAVSKWEQEN